MIRIVCHESDCGPVLGGADRAASQFKTFDVEFPEVERWLAEAKDNTYLVRQIVGAEPLAERLK